MNIKTLPELSCNSGNFAHDYNVVQLKRAIIKALYNAGPAKVRNTPEWRLILAVVTQAITDIGTPYESPHCWHDGSMDLYLDLLDFNPEYVRRLLSMAGLLRL